MNEGYSVISDFSPVVHYFFFTTGNITSDVSHQITYWLVCLSLLSMRFPSHLPIQCLFEANSHPLRKVFSYFELKIY